MYVVIQPTSNRKAHEKRYCHAYWWPGDARSMVISTHGIVYIKRVGIFSYGSCKFNYLPPTLRYRQVTSVTTTSMVILTSKLRETVKFRYNTVKYNTILLTALQWLRSETLKTNGPILKRNVFILTKCLSYAEAEVVEIITSCTDNAKNFVKSTFLFQCAMVKLQTHKRHPIPRPHGRVMGCLFVRILQDQTCYNGTALYVHNTRSYLELGGCPGSPWWPCPLWWCSCRKWCPSSSSVAPSSMPSNTAPKLHGKGERKAFVTCGVP